MNEQQQQQQQLQQHHHRYFTRHQSYIVRENALQTLVRRLVRKYHLDQRAKKWRIDLSMPQYKH